LELQKKRLREYSMMNGLTVTGVSMGECSRFIFERKGFGEVMEVLS